MWPEMEVIDFRRHLKRRNLSPHTVRHYWYHLKQFFTAIAKPVLQVTSRDVTTFIAQLFDRGLKAKTINCYLNSLCQLYEFWREEQDPDFINPVHRIYFLKEEDRLPNVATPNTLDTFLACVGSPRDRAIFLLMLRSGLRVQEVTGLTVQDCDFRHRTLKVRQAKNRRERITYLSEDTLAALHAYLKPRSPLLPDQPLFLGRKGQYKTQGLSVRAIQKLIERYRERAGVSIHCHQFRHVFASDLLTAGVDLVVIQELLGHRQIQTTQNYCRVANEKVRANYFEAMRTIVP